MSKPEKPGFSVQKDNWENLKDFTNARIALGNVGGNIPLKEVLKLKLAHAEARDSVFTELNTSLLKPKLESLKLPVYEVQSQAKNRKNYLKRPDCGRALSKSSEQALQSKKEKFDIVFILADGLSPEAVNEHATEVLNLVIPEIYNSYNVCFVLASQARVAIGDPIGELLNAKFSVVLIGERPGLSSPKSLGIYTTYNPKTGLTDESRNCISNIHNNGLSHLEGASLLLHVIHECFSKKLSGVNLKIQLNRIAEK